MGLEKQDFYKRGVKTKIDWPAPPKPIDVAGVSVITHDEFTRWLADFSLAMTEALEKTNLEIESLKSDS